MPFICFNNAVGVADPNIIADNQMTASSTFKEWKGHLPANGRLNEKRGYGWCALSCCENFDWLQVDLGKTYQMCGLATQGSSGSLHEWVTEFKLSFSLDGDSWTIYQDVSGKEMVSFSSICIQAIATKQ